MSKILMDKKVIKSMEEINRVMIGKERTVHQIMTAILAGGHVLIEDIPGVGKTTLALAFSKVSHIREFSLHRILCRQILQDFLSIIWKVKLLNIGKVQQ